MALGAAEHPGGTTEVTVVVPTVGRSPLLRSCLEALQRQRPRPRIVLVAPVSTALEGAHIALADELVRPRAVGFSAAVNAGFAVAGSEWIGTVNDDVEVADDWLATLREAVEGRPDSGAIQGMNLHWDQPTLIEGCGIELNQRWQAVQIGGGGSESSVTGEPRLVWGVSATAVLYRRAAVDDARALAPARQEVFDEALVSYYEDVELSWRLRASGWNLYLAPRARARHRGAATLADRRWRWVYRNRYPVLASALGRRYAAVMPRLLGRDLIDAGRAFTRGEVGRGVDIVRGIVAGSLRSLSRLSWRRPWPLAPGEAENGRQT